MRKGERQTHTQRGTCVAPGNTGNGSDAISQPRLGNLQKRIHVAVCTFIRCSADVAEAGLAPGSWGGGNCGGMGAQGQGGAILRGPQQAD